MPRPASEQLLVRVSACAVCRTDLHIVDGELPDPKLPLIPGHQIVGRVEEIGDGVEGFSDRRSRRHSMAGLDGWRMRLLSIEPRKSLRSRAFHWVQHRRRLRGICRGRRAILFPSSRSIQRCRCRAASLRRHDRLSFVSQDRGRAPARHLRFRFRRAFDYAKSRALKGAKFLPSHGRAMKPVRNQPANWVRCGPAAPTKCRPRDWMPPSSSHRSARLCRLRYARWQKAAWSFVVVFI